MGFRRVGTGIARAAGRMAGVVLLAGFTAGCVWPFGGNEGIGPGESSGLSAPQAPRPREMAAVDLADVPSVASGVNAFLWRASLDTIGFMPLASADPYGGVIITDWLASPDNPSERFKITVYVLDPELRADAVKVAIFRQTMRVNGIWADAAVDPQSPIKIENTILARARQLRLRADVG
jgi:hypothetical protein